MKSEGNYINGQLEGKNTFYYPNKVVAAVGYFKNGYKTGPWIYREKNGKVKEKELYKLKGELANKKETDDFFNKNKVVFIFFLNDQDFFALLPLFSRYIQNMLRH